MTTPLHASEIDELPGVKASFQTDRSLQPIYESSPRATDLAAITSVGLKFVASLAKQSGQGSLDRIVVSSEKERLMVFSLNPPNAESVGPRLFGLLTEPAVRLELVADAVNEIVEG